MEIQGVGVVEVDDGPDGRVARTESELWLGAFELHAWKGSGDKYDARDLKRRSSR